MSESAAPGDPAAPPPRCLACGAAGAEPWAVAWDAEYRTSEDRFRYLRCGRCGVLYIDPVPTDRLAEIYPTNYYAYVSGERSFVHRVKDWLDSRRLRRILRSIPGERLAVLDVGGGDGWQLSLIRRLDPRVASTFVVDMDPQAEAHARRQGHGYFCGRIQDFEANRRFDLVLLLNLIEHVAEPERVLARLRAGLSEHGVILVKTPNHDSLDARCFRRRNWAGFHCPRHWVLFERESFRTLAARAGLAVRELGYTQGAAFWANSVLFALAERGVVSITRERPAMSHPLFPLLAAPFAAFDLARAALGGRPSQMFVTLTRA